MPIYEFKCLKCLEFFELLVINNDDEAKLQCPKCKSEDFERILSAAGHCMGTGTARDGGAQSKTRNCPGGSCTTYEIPGPN